MGDPEAARVLEEAFPRYRRLYPFAGRRDAEALGVEEAIALGRIIEVQDAWCPEHGRSRPEMVRFPFTITDAALAWMSYSCPGSGCEAGVLLVAQAVEAASSEHLELYRNDETRELYLVHNALPVARSEDGRPTYAMGVTPLTPDRPLGGSYTQREG